jgi:phage terminase Nu1 subunit (DNA packaging protein)
MPHKTVREIAEFYGLHYNTVRDWIKAGCPYVQAGRKGGGEGKEWILDPYEVEKWQIERKVKELTGGGEFMELDEAKRKKMTAEAGLAELELMKEQGVLIEIDKVATEIGEQLSNFRAKMLSLPSKVSAQVYTAKDIKEIKSILEDAIYEALNEIRGYGSGIATDEFEESDSGANEKEAEAAS